MLSGAPSTTHARSMYAGDVSDFTVDLANQEVFVTGTIPYEHVYEKIKKTGKEVCRNCFSSASSSDFPCS